MKFVKYSISFLFFTKFYLPLKFILRHIYLCCIYPIIVIDNKLNYFNYREFLNIKGFVELKERRKLCSFAHFDKNGEIKQYVENYIRSLYETGFSIVFVSSSENLQHDHIKKIIPFVSNIIIRPNIGLDFGGHYIVIKKIIKNLEDYDQFLIANDSVYGPLYDLQEVLKNFKTKDIFAITDSYYIRYHLQSYFILIGTDILKKKILSKFFDNFLFAKSKTFIVYKYELGLSNFLIKKGYKPDVLCDYNKVLKYFLKQNKQKSNFINKKIFYDQSLCFFYELVTKFKCPFIKKSVIDYSEYLKILSKLKK